MANKGILAGVVVFLLVFSPSQHGVGHHRCWGDRRRMSTMGFVPHSVLLVGGGRVCGYLCLFSEYPFDLHQSPAPRSVYLAVTAVLFGLEHRWCLSSCKGLRLWARQSEIVQHCGGGSHLRICVFVLLTLPRRRHSQGESRGRVNGIGMCCRVCDVHIRDVSFVWKCSLVFSFLPKK